MDYDMPKLKRLEIQGRSQYHRFGLYIPGWWFLPLLRNMRVKWDDYSQLNAKIEEVDYLENHVV